MRLFPVCSFLALAPALAAQAVVSPAHFTLAEGNSYDNVIVSSTSVPYVYLEIHGDLQGTPRTINSLAFRRDGNVNLDPRAAYSIICDVYMSTAVKPTTAPDRVFANNHGADKQQVAQFKVAQFPATPAGGLSNPFVLKVPLAQPFAFGGQGPLCWELRTTSSTLSSAFNMDWVNSSSTNPAAQTHTFGTGCKATGYTSPITMTGSSNPNWPQSTITLTFNGQRLPASSVITLGVGSSTTSWGGVPLPFELPGTGAATSGACTVYNNLLITLPQLTNASGTLSGNLGVPANPAYNGFSIYTQAIALDAGANAWGLVTSNSVQHQIIAPYTAVPVGDVYASNLSGTGTARANSGLVVLFE